MNEVWSCVTSKMENFFSHSLTHPSFIITEFRGFKFKEDIRVSEEPLQCGDAGGGPDNLKASLHPFESAVTLLPLLLLDRIFYNRVHRMCPVTLHFVIHSVYMLSFSQSSLVTHSSDSKIITLCIFSAKSSEAFFFFLHPPPAKTLLQRANIGVEMCVSGQRVTNYADDSN